MQTIIHPIEKHLIKQELSSDKFIRHTNKQQNEIYEINAHNSPNIMKEIGRLREIAYREVGSGTGKEADIDALDTAEHPYTQLIIWDPREELILGGYRYKTGWNATNQEGKIELGTARLFKYSDHFIQHMLPFTIELGRSFIRPEFQSTAESRRAIFTLDNLWDGLGSLIVRFPQMKYFFGQVSIYKNYDRFARDLVLYYLSIYFPDPDEIIQAHEPLPLLHSKEELTKIIIGDDKTEDYKRLSKEVRKRGEAIPPLINSYMNISPSMKTFGTVDNPYFFNMEDTGILITLADIYPEKKDRHLTY